MSEDARAEPRRGEFHATPRELWDLTKATVKEFVEDKVPNQAAALAYYALFALGPLLLLAVSVAGLVMGAGAAREAIMGWLGGVLGQDAAGTVADIVAGAGDRTQGGIFAVVLGSAVLVFAAAGLFAHLKDALNHIWEVEHEPRGDGWLVKLKDVVRQNLARFLAVLAVGALVLASVLASTALAFLGSYVTGLIPGGVLAWQAVTALVSLALFTLAFATLYRTLPDVSIDWRDTWVGAGITALLFLVGQLGISYYLARGTLASQYGAAGAVVVILVWMYYSALVLFLGAEFTQVFANRYGRPMRPEPDAQPLQEAVRERHASPPREGTDGGEHAAKRRRERGAH